MLRFFSSCLSRCRQNKPMYLESDYDESLLPTTDEKQDVSKDVVLTIQDKDFSFEETKHELTSCISLLTAHTRSMAVYGRIPGALMTIITGFVMLKLISDVSERHRWESELALFESLYDTTWVNSSYVFAPFGGPSITEDSPYPWPRAYDNTTCKYANYPFNFTTYHSWRYNSRKMEDIQCAYYRHMDFRNTIGLAICAEIIKNVCNAFSHLSHHDFPEIYIFVNVISALLMLVCCRWSLADSMPCIKLDSGYVDILYEKAKQHLIFFDSRDQFESYLKKRPHELLRDYQTRVEDLERKHHKYLSRLAIADGFLENPRNKSTLTVLRDDPYFEKKLLNPIFEFAEIDNGNLSARRAVLDVTQEKNGLRKGASNLHHFFFRLHEQDEDNVNKYDKKKIMGNIFKFAGI